MEKDSLVYDILKEIFNVGVGRAADMLSQMLNKKILLHVPDTIIHQSNDQIDLEEYFVNGMRGTLMVSSLSFGRDLTGEANLIFPAGKIKTIINLSLEEKLVQENNMDFTDIDYDVIKEIGNIILNSIIGEMSNALSMELDYTLPNVEIFELKKLENRIREMEDMNSLLLIISFEIDGVEVAGAIIINFTINSLKEILEIIMKMEENLYG